MKYRIEKDSMGEIKVPENKYWGAQTQRSLQNFMIGNIKMPIEIIKSLAFLKKACATINNKLKPDKLSIIKRDKIISVCDLILADKLNDEFPLVVFQTGSGTQTNMNVNEVIANKGNELNSYEILHPNDDVNMSQSSNDIFPSAMHIAAVIETEMRLIPSLIKLINSFEKLEKENVGIIKSGRTHLQDATPISFSQEVSGWKASLKKDLEMINLSLNPLKELAIGGTAVGTGINAPKEFGKYVCEELTNLTNINFVSSDNKFHSLTSKDELVFAHGALKALACDLMKIANDIRLLSSGPRCGLTELFIPENEPGSSIMPGKVNPTQCEAVTMVAVQVIGNDTCISVAASQGNFELNVFMPVIISNYLQSIKLLTDVMISFEKNCVSGIKVNKEKMEYYLNNSLMIATLLSPIIGYDNTAKVVKKAYTENITLKEACSLLNLLTNEENDKYIKIEKLI